MDIDAEILIGDHHTPPASRHTMDETPPPTELTRGTLLRDNRATGARLVVVSFVADGRVHGFDHRTGRHTSFRVDRVGDARAAYSVIPPDEVDAAMQRVFVLRLGPGGGDVIDLAARRRQRGD